MASSEFPQEKNQEANLLQEKGKSTYEVLLENILSKNVYLENLETFNPKDYLIKFNWDKTTKFLFDSEQSSLSSEPLLHEIAKESLGALREERDELRLQNGLMITRVAEERRNAARETQRYDQLLQEFHKLQEHNKQLLSYRKDASTANNETLKLLTSREEGRLRMFELYEGVVEHLYGDEAVVVFEIDDDIVEHTYKRSQFVDQQLPSEGDRLIVYVHVADAPTDRSDMTEEDLMMDSEDEQPEYERKKITGEYEF